MTIDSRSEAVTWEEFVETAEVHFDPPEFRKYLKKGFATPTGKVELKSTAFEELGLDPLPYFRENPPVDPEYPLMLFTGVSRRRFLPNRTSPH